jgi:hypothetical protein
VAVGSGPGATGEWLPLVISSPDGVNWERQWLEADFWATGIAHGPESFVLVREEGMLIWSLKRAPGGWEAGRLSRDAARLVAFDGERFTAVGNANLVTSEDGVEWRWFRPGGSFREVAFGDGQFVVGFDHSGGWSVNYAVATSSDLELWTTRAAGSGSIKELIREGDGFVAFAGGESWWASNVPLQMLRSQDGHVWETVETGISGTVRDVLVRGDSYVAVGSRFDGDIATIWVSTDRGVSWGEKLAVPGGYFTTVRSMGDWLLVRGELSNIGPVEYVSCEGSEWTLLADPAGFWPSESETLGALSVGVDDGRLWLERGDDLWRGYRLPGDLAALDVVYADGRLVAVGDGPVWVSSPLVILEPPVASATPEGAIRWTMGVWGPPGSVYQVEVSDDLQRWEGIGTVTGDAERTEIDLQSVTAVQPRYYRVVVAGGP